MKYCNLVKVILKKGNELEILYLYMKDVLLSVQMDNNAHEEKKAEIIIFVVLMRKGHHME